jgi:hypothetical protein
LCTVDWESVIWEISRVFGGGAGIDAVAYLTMDRKGGCVVAVEGVGGCRPVEWPLASKGGATDFPGAKRRFQFA